jgi:tellurite resistance protein TehA-like permease
VNQRQVVSWLLPIVGLAFVGSELQRLLDERAAGSSPDPLFLVVALAFGAVFAARLGYLAIVYFRSR